MIDIFKKWLDRYFHHEEAILLLVIIVTGLVVVITMGDILAPVIASVILAYLMQGVSSRLQRLSVPRGIAVTTAFTLFMGGFLAFLLIFMPMAISMLRVHDIEDEKARGKGEG